MLIKGKNTDLLKFVNTLYDRVSPESFIYLQQYNDGDKSKTLKTPEPVAIPDLVDKIKKNELPEKYGFSLCVTPNVFLHGDKSRKYNEVTHVTSIFIDIDELLTHDELSVKFTALGLKPTLINARYCQTDANGQHRYKYHLYFLFSTAVENTEGNKTALSHAREHLIKFFDADKLVKNEKAVLRLPYTKHFKTSNENSTFYATIYTDAERVSLDDLLQVCSAPLSGDGQETPGAGTKTENAESVPETTSQDAIIDLIKNVYRDVKKVDRGAGRSRELFLLGINSFSWGLSLETALELGDWLNEFLFTEPEELDVIKHQIESAYRYHRGEFGEYRQELVECKTELSQNRFIQKQKLYYRVFHSLKPFVYVFEGERLINMNGTEYTTLQQINHYLAHVTQSKIKLDEILQRRLITVCDKMTFYPGRPRLYKEGGKVFYNRFNADILPRALKESDVNKKAVKAFCDHLKYLTNTDYEYEAVLNYFSFCIQKPAEKLPYALCIVSDEEGTGRSMLSEILFDRFFGDYSVNVENSELDSGFNEYMADTLMVFVHELAQGDSYSIMNKLKNKITEKKFTVNEKYAKKYTIRNICNFVFFSNKINALRVAEKDRRLLVVHNKKQPREQKYYDDLAETFKEHYQSIYTFLQNKDLSKFNPNARPEITSGKQLMIEQSKTELQLYLTNLMNERAGVFRADVFTIEQIIQYCDDNSPQALKYKVSYKSVRQFLLESGCKSRFIQKRLKSAGRETRIRKTYYSLPDFDLEGADPGSLLLAPVFESQGEGKKEGFKF